MNKPYKLGILVGRFQTLHMGHEDMINTAISLCERVVVFVGSSQESGTNKNPFSYTTREKILKCVFGDKISVFPLPDIGVGNNAVWGEYVMKSVIDAVGTTPDLFVSGKEERRESWLSGDLGASVAELYIPKTIDISASAVREYMINRDVESWKKYTNQKLYGMFDELRTQLISSKDKTETKSI